MWHKWFSIFIHDYYLAMARESSTFSLNLPTYLIPRNASPQYPQEIAFI